jgi:hypothetical protein
MHVGIYLLKRLYTYHRRISGYGQECFMATQGRMPAAISRACGKTRAQNMTPEEREAAARKAAGVIPAEQTKLSLVLPPGSWLTTEKPSGQW